MKTLLPAILLALSFGIKAQEPNVEKKVFDFNVEGQERIDLHKGLECRQAYEKTRGKRFHKRLLHSWTTKRKANRKLKGELRSKVTKDDVKRAIDYGFITGSYCKDGRLLSVGEFKNITIENIRFLKTADENNGTRLEDLVTGPYELSCKDLIKMPKTKREDGHTRSFWLLRGDLHNIHTAYENEKEGKTLQTRAELSLEKKKDRYFRRVLKKAVRKYDDDSLTLAHVKSAFDEAIEDGSACADERVLRKGQLEDILLDRLSNPHDLKNVSDLTQSEINAINLYFQNGRDKKEVRIDGAVGSQE